MTTLTEFLLARIAQDEADANVIRKVEGDLGDGACWIVHAMDNAVWDAPTVSSRRMLAEVEMQRWMVETFGVTDYSRYDDPKIMRRLALPYADHPDYREEWAL